MAWTVYVLCSKSHAATYVGVTKDVERRLEQHNGLQPGGARTTRAGRPWTVGATYGPFDSRAEGQRVEHSVKRLRGHSRLSWTPGDAD